MRRVVVAGGEEESGMQFTLCQLSNAVGALVLNCPVCWRQTLSVPFKVFGRDHLRVVRAWAWCFALVV